MIPGLLTIVLSGEALRGGVALGMDDMKLARTDLVRFMQARLKSGQSVLQLYNNICSTKL